MYDKFAEVYDLIYSFLDYEKSAEILTELIKKYKKSDGKRLLDVGCGTGKHLSILKEKYSCVGVDISEEMLEYAKKHVNGVEFRPADMITMDLEEKFDIILCLFSSIGYVLTLENLRKTITNFANHLKPGGVVIIEPWLTPSVATDGLPSMTTYEDDDLKIARLNVVKVEGNISSFVMHFLIARRNEDVTYFKEKHDLGLFKTQETLNIMRDAGLETIHIDDGLEIQRGLFIGKKH
jgi:ubiquinone/menaquinone biosynthesis C-methylase UbiE